MKTLRFFTNPWVVSGALLVFFGASFLAGYWVGHGGLGGAATGPRQRFGAKHPWKDRWKALLAKRLSLSDTQVKEIEPIIEEEFRRAGQAMRRHHLEDRVQLLKELQSRIEPMLTPEQREKFDRWVGHMVENLQKKIDLLSKEGSSDLTLRNSGPSP
jgi:Spy/CpxP family protein refolding chaperone